MSSPPSVVAPPAAVQSVAYVAPCSIPLSAGLSVIVSTFDTVCAPNPFRVDFITEGTTLYLQMHGPQRALNGSDPRTHSYIALLTYRLLRHLIPPTSAVVACAAAVDGVSTADRPPPTSPPSMAVACAALERRIADVFPAGTELQQIVVTVCKGAQDLEHPDPCRRVDAVFVQGLLSVDGVSDEGQLSGWQRWLMGGSNWQVLAGAVVEYIWAEVLELLGNELNALSANKYEGEDEEDEEMEYDESGDEDEEEARLCRIRLLHDKVLAGDDEVLALWLTLGMPAECPPGTDVDLHTAYRQQFKAQMKAAVAVSAPWMFDRQQVEARVSQWQQGLLPSGDALFFQRFHIRPLWHEGIQSSDFGLEDRHYPEDSVEYRDFFFPVKAGFEVVDAAGVSRALVIECGVRLNANANKQRVLHVTVREAGGRKRRVVYSFDSSRQEDSTGPWLRTALRIEEGRLLPGQDEEPPNLFSDYVCHGHLHGLSDQQWDEMMGGRLNVDYHTGHFWEVEHESKYDAQAAVSKAGMFPTELSAVVDRDAYCWLQRAEIRRTVAIASRLAMLDEGVDVAVFPPFQPSDMRQRFEAAAQQRMETVVLGFPAPLPRDLQSVVGSYDLDIPVDIPV